MNHQEFVSKYNREDIVEAINLAIKDFIAKHSSNVTIWTDEDYMFIQLSNLGLRDEYFKYISYIANNTTNEEHFNLFNLPCACVYASETILRFRGKTSEMVKTIVSRTNNENVQIDGTETDGVKPEFDFELKAAEKITKRVTESKRFINAVKKEEEKKSYITVYILSGPEQKQEYSDDDSEMACWVEWTLTGIIKVEAGTTWNELAQDPRLQNSDNGNPFIIDGDNGSTRFGPFNISFVEADDTNEYQNGIFVGKTPRFRLPSSVQVGDIIDSRDYVCNEIFNPSGGGDDYQTDAWTYQKFGDYSEHSIVNDNSSGTTVEFGDSMVYDGSIITL